LFHRFLFVCLIQIRKRNVWKDTIAEHD